MQAISFGLIQVAAPGTPVQITTDPAITACLLMVRTIPGFTGKTYLGLQGMNKNSATKNGVIRVLSEPSFGPQDGELIPPTGRAQGNVIRVSDFWVDADVAGEGVLVTGFVA